MGKKKKKKAGSKKREVKSTETKKTEEKETEEKKSEEEKTEEKKTEEKKAKEKKPESKKKSGEISEAEKKQREKNRQKALKESRSKKSKKAKAKFRKERKKKAEQKASKKVRKSAARKDRLNKLVLKITSFSLPENVRKNILFAAFFIAVIMINTAVFMTSNGRQTDPDKEDQIIASEEEFLLPEDEEDTLSGDEVSADEVKEEPEEEPKSSSSFNAALSKEDNMQDVYPHEGGLYFMPVSNDEESVTGALLGTCILKKDEYEALEEGQVVDFANDKYMILSISRGGDFGTALSMTAFDEDEDYERVFKEEKSYEDYFGYEKIVYGLTLQLEEEQIKQMGSTDYFKDDGYDEDDMIFFAGSSLYFPLTYTMDENVTLYFDDDCALTVPDDTMISDEEYDAKDYLAGKNPMYPPDLMAAKIETKGNRITKYNVMFAGLESLE